ncbi:MAG TPA: hypothetical protein GX707_16665 [Epulopiscium sp.]|nr:hypothetical protein [Candidatus Epulonipiscium sp.]
MGQEEIGQVVDWAVMASDEYGITITKLMQVYKAMRKHHGDIETRNLIEKGFSMKGE